MFIHIKHGDDQQFLANTNCSLLTLLQYVRTKLGLPDPELVDLCDDQGVLKHLFLSPHPEESASTLLQDRYSFIVCKVNRNPKDGAYVSITPLMDNPDHALLDALQTQANALERTRRQQQLRAAATAPQTKHTQPAKGPSPARAPEEEPPKRTASLRTRKGPARTPRELMRKLRG